MALLSIYLSIYLLPSEHRRPRSGLIAHRCRKLGANGAPPEVQFGGQQHMESARRLAASQKHHMRSSQSVSQPTSEPANDRGR